MKLGFEGEKALRSVSAQVRAIPEASQRAAYRSVNSVLARVNTQARRDIAGDINLTQAYIRDQMRLTKASPRSLVAIVKVRRRPVRLARFSAKQLTQAAARARGDTRRGIPAGRKQAGVSVAVSRGGGRRVMRSAFLIPLRAGSDPGGNGMGVFVRTGPGEKDIRHLYGPSPDQLFRRWRREKAPDIQKMLTEAYASQLRYEIRGRRT